MFSMWSLWNWMPPWPAPKSWLHIFHVCPHRWSLLLPVLGFNSDKGESFKIKKAGELSEVQSPSCRFICLPSLLDSFYFSTSSCSSGWKSALHSSHARLPAKLGFYTIDDLSWVATSIEKRALSADLLSVWCWYLSIPNSSQGYWLLKSISRFLKNLLTRGK